MGRLLSFQYGVAARLLLLGAVLYAVGFVGGFVVPKTIDSGSTASLGEAFTIDLLLLSLLGTVVLSRGSFKQWWVQWIRVPVGRSTYLLLVGLALVLLFWQWRPIPILVLPEKAADPIYGGLLMVWASSALTVGHLLLAAAALACGIIGILLRNESLITLLRAESRLLRQSLSFGRAALRDNA